MKISVITLLLLIFPIAFFAQTIVKGIVIDNRGTPIVGANVYLEGAYDGSTSDEYGKFSFETSETGIQTLIVSYVSFETSTLMEDISNMTNLKIILREDVNSLETVTISAGSFSA